MSGNREVNYNNILIETLWDDSRNLVDSPLLVLCTLYLEPLSLSHSQNCHRLLIMLLHFRDSSSPLLSTASGSSTPTILPDILDNHFPSSAYDPHLSNLPFQIVYTFSETNPPSPSHVSENIHSSTNLTTSCCPEALTFILDTPLPLRLVLQEPPPPLPVQSHQRFLSRFPDWSGTPSQYNYSIEVPLQPGVNHVVWCSHRNGKGIETSFLPPSEGDWPTISPHPTEDDLVLHFFYLRYDCARVGHMTYEPLSLNRLSSHPLPLCNHPPTVAVYSRSRTVPSLMRTALLAVVGQGYLAAGTRLGHLVPHRIVDETYHYLRIAEMSGAIVH
jgi:hypothetical protein